MQTEMDDANTMDTIAPRSPSKAQKPELQCIGTGLDVECVIPITPNSMVDRASASPITEGTPTSSPASTIKDDSISARSSASPENVPLSSSEKKPFNVECIGTGTDVECVITSTNGSLASSNKIASRAASSLKSKQASFDSFIDSASEATFLVNDGEKQSSLLFSLKGTWEYLVLISPFFFWGTAMVAMKGVLPKAGPLFVAATRLIPSGFLLIAFATFQNRKQPSGLNAWLAIALFAFVDASCFQGFLAEGLKRTSAGLGSVIIDSQPLTVAVLASILFGESIGALGVFGLATGVIGLLLLEVPTQVFEDLLKGYGLHHMGEPSSILKVNDWSIWDSGEWWMLLAAQSMAVGTVMVRWLCQFADPVMATGWHMVLGGIPLLALASFQHDPALSGHIQDLEVVDWVALLYTSVFGSAVSYGVFFYNASQGSLTKLSSLTFLTPMFAALFGYILLDETLNATQIVGASVTLASIYLINSKAATNDKDDIV